MIGILVVATISWLLLWFSSKEHLLVLGISSNIQRLKEFTIGALFMALMCCINLLGQAHFKGISYTLNPAYGFSEGLIGSWWTFKAAIFEELIFRGAILYLLIKAIGINKACTLSAIAFGIYHWFSYEMFGRGFIPMTYVFLLTGASGWMFAYSFAKTKSLYAPLGLHFGWIVVSIVFLSAGPLGDSLFILEGNESELSNWEQLLAFVFQTFIVPGIIIWILIKKYNTIS